MKTKLFIAFWIGLFIGASILRAFDLYITPLQPKIIYLDEKKDECIAQKGEYNLRDWSMEDDGSDYRATCKIPEHTIWEIKLK